MSTQLGGLVGKLQKADRSTVNPPPILKGAAQIIAAAVIAGAAMAGSTVCNPPPSVVAQQAPRNTVVRAYEPNGQFSVQPTRVQAADSSSLVNQSDPFPDYLRSNHPDLVQLILDRFGPPERWSRDQRILVQSVQFPADFNDFNKQVPIDFINRKPWITGEVQGAYNNVSYYVTGHQDGVDTRTGFNPNLRIVDHDLAIARFALQEIERLIGKPMPANEWMIYMGRFDPGAGYATRFGKIGVVLLDNTLNSSISAIGHPAKRAHEYTHVIVADGNAPVYFHEGLAELIADIVVSKGQTTAPFEWRPEWNTNEDERYIVIIGALERRGIRNDPVTNYSNISLSAPRARLNATSIGYAFHYEVKRTMGGTNGKAAGDRAYWDAINDFAGQAERGGFITNRAVAETFARHTPEPDKRAMVDYLRRKGLPVDGLGTTSLTPHGPTKAYLPNVEKAHRR
ncbi:hypothetical protein HY640_02480 [Candidatus Woesearchaeota archaeon]|nr:hypothetical protein [Candidatus Woesearchaeota archaeon]